MLTGVFKDRTRLKRLAAQTAHRALREIINSPELSPHRAVHLCEIGPFVVDYVFKSRSLVVELEPPCPESLPRAQARAAFLKQLGYRVLVLSRRDVRLRPRKVLSQLEAALR